MCPVRSVTCVSGRSQSLNALRQVLAPSFLPVISYLCFWVFSFSFLICIGVSSLVYAGISCWLQPVKIEMVESLQSSPPTSTERDCVALLTLVPHIALLPQSALKA